MKSEAELHRKLVHPNIVRFLALVFEPENYGLVMEYLENGEIRDFLENNRHFTWREKLELLKGVVLGMTYLHGENVIHGDLKFENVLIGENQKAKVCIFKICLDLRFCSMLHQFIDMKLVQHFVKCQTVAVPPTQIIIIIVIRLGRERYTGLVSRVCWD